MTTNENAKCHRTVCNSPHDDCVHSQTGFVYCERCAVLINRANPQVPDLVTIPRKQAAAALAAKFTKDEIVTIRSTEELPTKFDGDQVYIDKQHFRYKEFWSVIGHRTEGIYHESQLEKGVAP